MIKNTKEVIESTGLRENYVHKSLMKMVKSDEVERLDRGKYKFAK